MRRILFTLTILFFSVQMMAQAPDAFQYQAVLRDADGNIRSNENLELGIAILQNAADGTEVYSETHTTSTNEQGLVQLMIGEGDATGDLSTVDWSAGPYFIEISVDGTVMGTSQLLSVPYAKYASTAATANSVMAENQNLADVMANGNSAGNARIMDVAEPVENQDATNKAYVDALLQRLAMLETMVGVDTLEDAEGNIYKTVRIGNQVWMAEGLRATKYPDGSDISGLYWANDDFNNDGNVDGQDSAYYVSNYGFLYTAAAAMNGAASSATNPSGVQGPCPTGWHLPSLDEFAELQDTLGGYFVAGGKLKDTNTEFWNSPNEGATNETGFSARGTGNYNDNGLVYQVNYGAYFWTATESSTSTLNQYVFRVFSDGTYFASYPLDKLSGSTIRCVKNE